MMRFVLGMAASILGCGGAHSSKMASPSVMAASGAGPAAADPSGNGATIATEPNKPVPGQLTAGVWDDNLNFEFFSAYASRMGRSQDLSAFLAADQRASHDAVPRGPPHTEL